MDKFIPVAVELDNIGPEIDEVAKIALDEFGCRGRILSASGDQFLVPEELAEGFKSRVEDVFRRNGSQCQVTIGRK